MVCYAEGGWSGAASGVAQGALMGGILGALAPFVAPVAGVLALGLFAAGTVADGFAFTENTSLKNGLVIVSDAVALFGGRLIKSLTEPPKIETTKPKTTEELVKEAHDQLDKTAQGYKTTAIGTDSEGNLYISSSDKTIPKPQRIWADKNGIKVVNREGYSEETIMKKYS